MDPSTGILLLTAAAFIGVLATVILLTARGRRADAGEESPYAASSEGSTVCPSCGSPTLASATDCIYCGAPLPEVKPLA